jgi:oxygen-dependent protoporphyrinogen oxidase
LAAAWELVVTSDRDGTPQPVVQVLEAEGRIGGKLLATQFAGRTVDQAADAFLARRPEATTLCEELGLDQQLVPVGASGASIWARGRLRPMPAALNVGIPTRWWPLFRSGILSTTESLRVARDLVVPHRGERGVMGDRSVGHIVGERLGRPVVERLADPLIGGIHAGNADDLSAAATMPLLIAASHQSGSLMRRLGRVRTPGQTSAGPTTAGPVFWSLADSTASLADALTTALIARGVTIRTNVRVDAIERSGPKPRGASRWVLSLHHTDEEAGTPPSSASKLEAVDGVVVTTPATEAAVLIAPFAPMAAGLLSTVEYASVAVITLSLPKGAIRTQRSGTGFLVPRTSIVGGHKPLITGCTYLDRKWPHLARPDDDLIRVSVGRYGDDRQADLDDDQLGSAATGELAALLDIQGDPLETAVTRWTRAFPQYQVGHLIKVAQVEGELAKLDGIALAGAALRGVGIPACIGSGRNAAKQVLESLSRRGNSAGSKPTVGSNGSAAIVAAGDEP